jgi:glycosyltransferase domain-containing protein
MPIARYTLVIPTYNRPEDLGRLLRFLAYQEAPFPILVLDSSRSEIHELNVATCRDLAAKVTLKRFDPEMSPWEKFSRGAELVETEFASLCADDDLVLVSGIRAVVGFMAENADFAVAHGWYFNFYLSGALGLTQVAYRSPTLGANDPIERLWQLFSNYEAITYGVHRTEVLRKSLSVVQGVQSMLWRELLGGAVAAVSGKIARLPVLYAGRSLGPSAPYVNWHPIDFLVTAPQALLEDYLRYRTKLLDHYRDCGHSSDGVTSITSQIDLIHLRYLSEYFKPKVLDYLFLEVRKGRSREEIMGGVWPVLLERQGVEGALQRSRILRRLRDRFAPWLRGFHVRKLTRRHAFRTEQASTASGASRAYHIYDEFQAQLRSGSLEATDLLAALAGYE